MRRGGSEPYFRNTEQARRSAIHQADFILGQIEALRKVDRDGRAEKAVRDFMKLLALGERLSKSQYSYLEGIYEKTMKGMGLDSVGVHSDPKPRGLRCG